MFSRFSALAFFLVLVASGPTWASGDTDEKLLRLQLRRQAAEGEEQSQVPPPPPGPAPAALSGLGCSDTSPMCQETAATCAGFLGEGLRVPPDWRMKAAACGCALPRDEAPEPWAAESTPAPPAVASVPARDPYLDPPDPQEECQRYVDAYRELLEEHGYTSAALGRAIVQCGLRRPEVARPGNPWMPPDRAFDAQGYDRAAAFYAEQRLTSKYGWRRHPVLKKRRFHTGVDYGMPAGKGLPSLGAGVVTAAGEQGGWGIVVEIEHPETGLRTRYCHLSKVEVSVGEHVVPGQIIGLVGSTGMSTGPHVHLEVREGPGRKQHTKPDPYIANPRKLNGRG